MRCVALPGGSSPHTHDALIDERTGNGRADPGGDGHMHEIIRMTVLPGGDDGHTHALSCPGNDAGVNGGGGIGCGI